MNKWFKSGSPWIWLSAGGVSISLISVLGLLWLIASRGLSYFWPSELYQFDITDEHGAKSVVIGEIYDREQIPVSQLAHLNLALDPEQEILERLLIKTGNRELVSLDFRWLLSHNIQKTQTPKDLVVVERRTNGNFYGFIESVVVDGKQVDENKLSELLTRVDNFQEQIDELQKSDIGAINYQLERLRLKTRKYQLQNKLTPELQVQIDSEVATLNQDYAKLEQ
ncbi:MAG: phosphate ABC transporter, permease protein PstA, partial [Colwellia sp.]